MAAASGPEPNRSLDAGAFAGSARIVDGAGFASAGLPTSRE